MPSNLNALHYSVLQYDELKQNTYQKCDLNVKSVGDPKLVAFPNIINPARLDTH